MRIWILTNSPSPYQVEYFSALDRSGKINIAVRFMRRRYPGQKIVSDPGDRFPHRFLRAWAPASWNDMFRLHPNVFRDILSNTCDLYILSGVYTSPTFQLSALILRWTRRPWAIWLEQPWPEDYRPVWAEKQSSKKASVRLIRKKLLKWLVKSADAVFCIGTAARDAYRQYGLEDAQTFILPYICDTKRFGNIPDEDKKTVVQRYGLEGKTTFLFSGLLNERKGVDILIPVFRKICTRYPDAMLLVLGDGPLRNQLENSLESELKSRVRFAGLVSQQNLPAHYAAADVFVFPSRHDGWGVVINEACAAGLPVIATRQTGAARDLVRDGYNGFLVDRDREDQFVEKIQYFLENPREIKVFGENSREVISHYTLEKGVEMLEQAAGEIVSGKGR